MKNTRHTKTRIPLPTQYHITHSALLWCFVFDIVIPCTVASTAASLPSFKNLNTHARTETYYSSQDVSYIAIYPSRELCNVDIGMKIEFARNKCPLTHEPGCEFKGQAFWVGDTKAQTFLNKMILNFHGLLTGENLQNTEKYENIWVMKCKVCATPRYYSCQIQGQSFSCIWRQKEWPTAKTEISWSSSSIDGQYNIREYCSLSDTCDKCHKPRELPVKDALFQLNKNIYCTECPPFTGQVPLLRGDLWKCDVCRDNKIPQISTSHTNLYGCDKCPTGYEVYSNYGSADHFGRCQICKPGTYEKQYADQQHGHSKCMDCEAGKYQSEPGKDYCTPCLGGHVINRVMCCNEWDHINIGGERCINLPFAEMQWQDSFFEDASVSKEEVLEKTSKNGLVVTVSDMMVDTWLYDTFTSQTQTAGTALIPVPRAIAWLDIRMYETINVRSCEPCAYAQYRDRCGGATPALDFYVKARGQEIKTVDEWRGMSGWTQLLSTLDTPDTSSKTTFHMTQIQIPLNRRPDETESHTHEECSNFCHGVYKELWEEKNTWMSDPSNIKDWQRYSSQTKFCVALELSDGSVKCQMLSEPTNHITYDTVMSNYPEGKYIDFVGGVIRLNGLEIVGVYDYFDVDITLALYGEIVRNGTCQACTSCGDGFLTQGCDSNTAGRCQQCVTACPTNQYWTHPHKDGCWPQSVNGVRTYMPVENYECKDCPVYRKNDDGTIIELLVGCSGRASIVRWHPHAEVKFESIDSSDVSNDATLEVTPQTAECAYDDSSACYYTGEHFTRSPLEFDHIYPKREDLKNQLYTTTIPYCPPGWYVKRELLDDNNQEYRAEACKKCDICDIGKGQKRRDGWRKCDGYGTSDTQTCTDAGVCEIGEFLNVTSGSCVQCTQCL
jgi:hypothetical protein